MPERWPTAGRTGLVCLVGQEEISEGQFFDAAIAENLAQARCVVVLWLSAPISAADIRASHRRSPGCADGATELGTVSTGLACGRAAPWPVGRRGRSHRTRSIRDAAIVHVTVRYDLVDIVTRCRRNAAPFGVANDSMLPIPFHGPPPASRSPRGDARRVVRKQESSARSGTAKTGSPLFSLEGDL